MYIYIHIQIYIYIYIYRECSRGTTAPEDKVTSPCPREQWGGGAACGDEGRSMWAR